MSAEEKNFISINTKIDNQELRIFQRDVQELKEQYENARKRETEASQMLSLERARCKTQELEIERRRKQLEESSDFIKKLQTELEDAIQTASGVKWELRENEIKSAREDEIIYYKLQMSGLEAKLKKKQMDLNSTRELLKQTSKLKEKEIAELRAELSKKEKILEDTIGEVRRNSVYAESLEIREKVNVLHERIGSLTAINEGLQDKINGMHAEKFEIENKLQYAEEDRNSLQKQVDSLREQLTDSEGASYQTNTYLNEEIDKVKHQKAQLRCEYLQLKRNFSRLEAENKTLNDTITELKSSDSKFEELLKNMEQSKEKLSMKNDELLKEITTLNDFVAEYQKKIEDLERQIKENEMSEDAKRLQFSSELEQYRKKIDSMRHALVELDSQCDRLMTKLKSVDQEKKSIQQDNRLLQKQLDEMRKSLESECKMKNDYATVSEENARLTLKVKYLENELRESHNEHRVELTRLAQKVTHAEPEAESLCKASELQSLLKQQESQNRYLERGVEQAKKELDATNKEVEDLRKRQCDLINDNTVLRQALAEAVKKGEQYRDGNTELKKLNESLLTSIQTNENKIVKLEDEIYELRTEISQKEKLVGYLQSVQQPKQMQKLKRNRSSYSTLISAGTDSISITDIELENQQCEELQRERDRLRTNLEEKKKILSEKQNEVVPLIKNGKNLTLLGSDDLQVSKTPTKKILTTFSFPTKNSPKEKNQ